MLERSWDRGLARYTATAGRGRTYSSDERRGPAHVAEPSHTTCPTACGEREENVAWNNGKLDRRECSPPYQPGTLTGPQHSADATSRWENNTRGPSVPSLRKNGLCYAGGAAPRRLVILHQNVFETKLLANRSGTYIQTPERMQKTDRF